MAMNSDLFLRDIQDFVKKSTENDALKKDVLTCNNIFKFDDKYDKEKEILLKIRSGNYSTTTEQGNLLEELLKSLFGKISLISSLSVTNKDTGLGQIDINLLTVDETIFDVWGMVGDHPDCMIGECKNYTTAGVARPEIEKTCWRAGKGRALSFFISKSYKLPAVEEISDFNLCKQTFLKNSQGVYIIPITIDMLDVIISNDINFCYFIRWAILSSKKMAIANYL